MCGVVMTSACCRIVCGEGALSWMNWWISIFKRVLRSEGLLLLKLTLRCLLDLILNWFSRLSVLNSFLRNCHACYNSWAPRQTFSQILCRLVSCRHRHIVVCQIVSSHRDDLIWICQIWHNLVNLMILFRDTWLQVLPVLVWMVICVCVGIRTTGEAWKRSRMLFRLISVLNHGLTGSFAWEVLGTITRATSPQTFLFQSILTLLSLSLVVVWVGCVRVGGRIARSCLNLTR